MPDTTTDIRINAEPMTATSVTVHALPEGVITLLVYAVDKLGAQSIAASATVAVSPFAVQVGTDAVEAVTTAAKDLIDTANGVDNPSGVMMAVECAADVLSTLAATSGDTASVAQRQTLRSTLFDNVRTASLKMTFTANAIEQRASSIEKLSSKPLELSTALQDDMVALLQNWSSIALNGTVSVTSAATTKQVGALSNLLRAKQVAATASAGAATTTGVDGSAIATAVRTMGAATLKAATGTGFTPPITIQTENIKVTLQRGRVEQLSCGNGDSTLEESFDCTWGSSPFYEALPSPNDVVNAHQTTWSGNIHLDTQPLSEATVSARCYRARRSTRRHIAPALTHPTRSRHRRIGPHPCSHLVSPCRLQAAAACSQQL